jgi:hypothetical protein
MARPTPIFDVIAKDAVIPADGANYDFFLADGDVIIQTGNWYKASVGVDLTLTDATGNLVISGQVGSGVPDEGAVGGPMWTPTKVRDATSDSLVDSISLTTTVKRVLFEFPYYAPGLMVRVRNSSNKAAVVTLWLAAAG